jgi:hypothetical protein
MVPINVGDVVWGVAAAQRLYSIGFEKVNNAGEILPTNSSSNKSLKDELTPPGQKYRDFGEDIRLLAINLDLISSIVQQAQSQAATFNAVSRLVPAAHQVLGNFRETLNDCDRLLDDQRYVMKHDGFVSNVSFYYQNDSEVQNMRDRITLHNIKVN